MVNSLGFKYMWDLKDLVQLQSLKNKKIKNDHFIWADTKLQGPDLRTENYLYMVNYDGNKNKLISSKHSFWCVFTISAKH